MKKFLSLILTLCIVFSLLVTVLSVTASAASHVKEKSTDGLSFSDYYANSKGYGSDYYQADKRLEEVPHTFEAWVNLYSGIKTPGTIIGNSGKGSGTFRFLIVRDTNAELSDFL